MRRAESIGRRSGSYSVGRCFRCIGKVVAGVLLGLVPVLVRAQGPIITPSIVWEREDTTGRASRHNDLFYYALGKLSPTRLVWAGTHSQLINQQQVVFPRLLFVRPNGDVISSHPLPQLAHQYSWGIQQVVPDPQGSFLAVGYGADSTGGYLRLFHFDSTGVLEWERRVSTAYVVYRPEWHGSIAVPDGYLIQTHQMEGAQSVGYGTLLKVNRQGEYQWHITLGRWSGMGASPPLACPDGSYVVCGASTSRFPLPHLIPWDYENLMLRIHPNGTILDSAYVGTPNCSDPGKFVQPAPDGGFVLASFRRAKPPTGQRSQNEGHFIKLDSQFHKQWEYRLASAVAGKETYFASGQALANGNYRAIGYTILPNSTQWGVFAGLVVEIAPPTGTGAADTVGTLVRQWTSTSSNYLRVLPQDDGTAYVAGVSVNSNGNQRYYAKLGGLGLPAPAPDLCAHPPRLTQPPNFQAVAGQPDSLVFSLDAATTTAGPRYGEVSHVTWDFGDGSPPQEGWAVAHRYAVPTPVRVRCTVTNNLWCTTTAELFPFGPVGRKEDATALAATISVYPNPSASGRFTVRTAGGGPETRATFCVTDAVGRTISAGPLTGAETALDLRTQPAGVYALRLTWPDGRAVTKRLVRW